MDEGTTLAANGYEPPNRDLNRTDDGKPSSSEARSDEQQKPDTREPTEQEEEIAGNLRAVFDAIATEDMPPNIRALLDAIAAEESGGGES